MFAYLSMGTSPVYQIEVVAMKSDAISDDLWMINHKISRPLLPKTTLLAWLMSYSDWGSENLIIRWGPVTVSNISAEVFDKQLQIETVPHETLYIVPLNFRLRNGISFKCTDTYALHEK